MTSSSGDGLEPTGERLLPDRQRGEIIHAEHLARYHLATRFAAAKRVLDAACGEGYGTRMLVDAGAASAVGIDLDEEVVSHARARYGLDYRCADIASLPFEDASFDLVVSFETIEHVTDTRAALAECRRVLDPGGLLILSSPNASQYSVDNPFHVREYTTEQLRGLLGQHFENVDLMYQQNWLVSTVLDEDRLRAADGERPLDVELVKYAGREPGQEVYTLALCRPSRSATPIPLMQMGVAADVFELYSLLEREARAQARASRAEENAAHAAERFEKARHRARKQRRKAHAARRQAAEERKRHARARRRIRELELTLPRRIAAAVSAGARALRRR